MQVARIYPYSLFCFLSRSLGTSVSPIPFPLGPRVAWCSQQHRMIPNRSRPSNLPNRRCGRRREKKRERKRSKTPTHQPAPSRLACSLLCSAVHVPGTLFNNNNINKQRSQLNIPPNGLYVSRSLSSESTTPGRYRSTYCFLTSTASVDPPPPPPFPPALLL